MQNAHAKVPSFPNPSSTTERDGKLTDFMQIGPSGNPSQSLEKLFSDFFHGFADWVEQDRQNTIKATIRELATSGYLLLATPIDPLTNSAAPQPVVLPGPLPIEVPPAEEAIPTPEPNDPERVDIPEPVEATDPLEEDYPVPMEPFPQLAQPQPLEIPPSPAPAKPAKASKAGKTETEKTHEKEIYRVRKAFQQRNYHLRKQGKPEIPQPTSWSLLLNPQDKAQDSDAPPSSEDG